LATDLGQVFTPPAVTALMWSWSQRQGRVLEPSCGDGAFLRSLSTSDGASRSRAVVAIEIDGRHAPAYATVMDFFDYPVEEAFDTIIGNPPYVRFQDINPSTQAKLQRLIDRHFFDARSNLYLFFIEKCVRHLREGGELIFITPRDFLKNTSSRRLNEWLLEQGRITHLLDLGDQRIFQGAVPNCVIWRFEKNAVTAGKIPSASTQFATLNATHLSSGKSLMLRLNDLVWHAKQARAWHGQLVFIDFAPSLSLADIAEVKVGGVSGADAIFANEAYGNREFVYSQTRGTGKTRKMWWGDDQPAPPCWLLPHREVLLARKIYAFEERNWWHWGRGYPYNQQPRVYVNARTRQCQPFFLHPCAHFDGSVMAVFPKCPTINLVAFCAALNAVDWRGLGFVCDGRFLFAQRSLEHAPLPANFEQFRS
jgi:adenine-specific DNA-methyltransferase